MNRRKEPRFQIQEDSCVTVLGERGFCINAVAIDISVAGICLHLPVPVPVGAAIKIENDRQLLLGEVCYCRLTPRGYLAGMKLDQVLSDLPMLHNLNRRLLNEDRDVPKLSSRTGVSGGTSVL